MKRGVIAALILSMGLLAGCGSKEEQAIQTIEGEKIVEETQEEVVEEQTGSSELKAIGERQVVDGKKQSYLTGEWKDEDVVNRRSIAVMMPNNKAALPQYGISKASIIYEAPVEGRITRLMGVYEDYDDLDRIGPVRSARDYYLYEAMALDSIYVNWGLAIPYVSPIINTDRIDNVSQAVEGIDKPGYEAFDRVSRPGYKTEYTGYMFLDGFKKAVDRLGYETEYTDRFKYAYQIADDGCRATYSEYPDATKICPGGTSTNSSGYGSIQATFTYNDEDHLYYRSEYGAPQVDELTGEQLAVSNVVFKVCHGEVRDDHDYLAFGVHGEGDCYVFTNGKVIKGTWKRDGDYEPNVLMDENGEEIILNQGKTWLCNIWKEYEEFVSYE